MALSSLAGDPAENTNAERAAPRVSARRDRSPTAMVCG